MRMIKSIELVKPEPEPGNLRLRFQQLNERVLGRGLEDDLRKEYEKLKDEPKENLVTLQQNSNRTK